MKADQCFYENRFSHAPLYNPSGFAVNLKTQLKLTVHRFGRAPINMILREP